MKNLSSRFVYTVLAVLLLLGGFSASAYAQGGTGTITGTVTDPNSLTVAAANVVILNSDTGIERPLTTTDSGTYTATFLQPGHYQVTVTKDGFSTVVRKDLVLQVGQTLTIDVAMTVGTSVSEITVTGEAPIIEPDRTEFSQTVSESLAAGLPLNGRRWEQFVFLTPGVTADGGSGLVSYHGISGLFNNSSVDGVNNQQAFFSESRGRTVVGYTYSLDAVKEFSVNSSAYSAEFGGAAGGQVNSVTKSGTNQFHGDLFYYLRYPSLNSLDPFAKTHGSKPGVGGSCPSGMFLNKDINPNQCIAQGERQRQQFGGAFGGPIISDKLFFFLNYDGQRRSFPIVYTGPSSDFATATLNAMITNNCGATVGGAAATVVGLTPTQCAAAVNYIQGTIGSQPRLANQDLFLAKLDYQLSTNNRISASLNSMNFRSPNGHDQSPTFSAGSITQNGSLGTHDRFFVASWNSVISPTVVNDFRFQWSRDFQFTAANFGGPSVSLSNLFGYGLRNSLPRGAFPDEHRMQFADSVSVVHNSHTFKFGVDVSPVHELLVNLFNGGGVYAYNYTDSAVAAPATLQAWIADAYGLALSSDLLPANATTCFGGGVVNNCVGRHYNTFGQAKDVLNSPQEQGKDDFYDVHYAAYGQDTWKVTPKLTLTLGLRWDMQSISQPKNPYEANPIANFYTYKINVSKFNFGPRFGFAWQAEKNTVLRGGYGLFYANTTNSLYYNTRVENGVVQKMYNCNASYTPTSGLWGTPSTCLTGTATLASVPQFPNVLFSPPGPALQAPFAGAVTPTSLNANPNTLNVSSLALRGQSPGLLEPMVHEMEVGVEHEFPGNISASATVLYTKGQHLPVCPDANLNPAGTPVNGVARPATATYNVLAGAFTGAGAPGSGTVTVPFYTSRRTPTTGASAVGIISACQSIVHSQYEALIGTLKKRFGHGFEFLANYTLAKSSDSGQVLGSTGTFSGSSDAPLDPYNQDYEWGTSDYDQRQRFVASFLYAPTFTVGNSVLSTIVNGFGFGGIVTVASPLPVNGLMNSSSSQSFGGFTAPDGGVTGGVSLNAGPNAGRIPNVSKNFFRAKTQVRNVDFRITRDIRLYSERFKLQIIGEAFNIFNHTIVTSVNTTAYAFAANTGATGTASATSCNTLNTVTPITNGFTCLVPQSSFLAPTATSNGLLGARQLQISGKFFF